MKSRATTPVNISLAATQLDLHPSAPFGLQLLSIVNLREIDFAMPHIHMFVLEQ